jgi:hypothetical protein
MNGNDDRRFTRQENDLFDDLEYHINRATQKVCDDHIPTDTEEPDLTARIAQAIETELQHQRLRVGDMEVRVDSHSIPSHGPGALERKSGVDLYISVIRDDGDGEKVSKGIILQSKQARALGRNHKELRNQAGRMMPRSNESYVVVFDQNSAVAVQAAMCSQKSRLTAASAAPHFSALPIARLSRGHGERSVRAQ